MRKNGRFRSPALTLRLFLLSPTPPSLPPPPSTHPPTMATVITKGLALLNTEGGAKTSVR